MSVRLHRNGFLRNIVTSTWEDWHWEQNYWTKVSYIDDESSLIIVGDDVDKMMATKMMLVVMTITMMLLVVGGVSTWSSSWWHRRQGTSCPGAAHSFEPCSTWWSILWSWSWLRQLPWWRQWWQLWWWRRWARPAWWRWGRTAGWRSPAATPRSAGWSLQSILPVDRGHYEDYFEYDFDDTL